MELQSLCWVSAALKSKFDFPQSSGIPSLLSQRSLCATPDPPAAPFPDFSSHSKPTATDPSLNKSLKSTPHRDFIHCTPQNILNKNICCPPPSSACSPQGLQTGQALNISNFCSFWRLTNSSEVPEASPGLWPDRSGSAIQTPLLFLDFISLLGIGEAGKKN